MLDLDALVGEMHGLAREVARSAEELVRQRAAAVAQLETAAVLPELREAVQRFNQPMALPAAGRPMDVVRRAPEAGDYTVIATDGSQVAPDYHHIAPWYVVNTGCAVFRYGIPGRDRCRLSSHPSLRPPRGIGARHEERAADAQAAAVAVRGQLEVDRLDQELALATRLLEEEADPDRSVLLLDGPLIQWRMIGEIRQKEARAELIARFQELLDAAYRSRTPIAGFVSRSRAVEWITLLRFTLCPDVAKRGEPCADCRKSLLQRNTDPRPEAHHAPLAGLRDIQLAQELLPEPGMRTEVVELLSDTWSEVTGGEDAAGFFYLNTGPEVARVELPRWVWESEPLMTRLHAVIWDQCAIGGGYPMVLAEAHEQAVVRAPDRAAFYGIIERVLGEHGFHATAASAKAVSKRRPMA